MYSSIWTTEFLQERLTIIYSTEADNVRPQGFRRPLNQQQQQKNQQKDST